MTPNLKTVEALRGLVAKHPYPNADLGWIIAQALGSGKIPGYPKEADDE